MIHYINEAPGCFIPCKFRDSRTRENNIVWIPGSSVGIAYEFPIEQKIAEARGIIWMRSCATLFALQNRDEN
jgi:hypothetical protein